MEKRTHFKRKTCCRILTQYIFIFFEKEQTKCYSNEAMWYSAVEDNPSDPTFSLLPQEYGKAPFFSHTGFAQQNGPQFDAFTEVNGNEYCWINLRVLTRERSPVSRKNRQAWRPLYNYGKRNFPNQVMNFFTIKLKRIS